VRALLALFALPAFAQPAATVLEQTHPSQVLGGARPYRVLLPPSYKTPAKRFPVIYWLHGYEAPDEHRDSILSAYVGSHNVILVDSGPADTTGNYPLYFPELVEHIDRTLRTIPDRAHRAITGMGTGGFLALWEAARSPDLVGSASSFMADREAEAGPAGFPVAMSLDDLFGGLAAVKTWMINARPDIAATLDFHLKAFADPLPKPEVFTHADPYPNFAIWDWQVASNRRSPGFTALENVSRTGFRSAVREWLPGGPPVAGVKVSVTSARLYPPGATMPVTYIHVRDRKTRHVSQRADAQGRLSFEVDGDEWEVGIGAGPVLAVAGYSLAEGAWAAATKPVKLRVAFLNKGAARSATEVLRWESPTPGVKFDTASGRLFGLAPGESAVVPVAFVLAPPERSSVRIVAVTAGGRMTLDVPLFPAAAPATDFEIADGKQVEGYPHPLGEGNRDGHASPGETVAILLREAGALRPAEVFTNDPCIDNSIRIADGGGRYSLPKVRESCEPGHVVHALARAGLRYAAIEFPVWYRQ
jgi:putative esterase